MLRKYLQKINPIVAVVVCAMCWLASIKTAVDRPSSLDPASLFYFAIGIFSGLTLFAMGRIWLLSLQNCNPGRNQQPNARKPVPNETPDNLDSHFVEYPDPETPFSLFQAQWQHFLLEERNGDTILNANRVNDMFIPFCAKSIGGLTGKTVLELGPFEGFHSYKLVECGAAKVVSIEANPRNFLKCLIVKNYYQLDPVSYLLGNFSEYLENTDERFDFILAAGVLYHQRDPFVVLDRIMKRTNSIGICTTFFDSHDQGFRFTGNTRTVNIEGAEPFVLHERKNPKGTLGRKHGIDKTAWMFTKDDLLRFLNHRNFDYEIRDTPAQADKGPRIQLIANRAEK